MAGRWNALRRDERGAVLVLMTAGLITLLVVAALVIDLAAVRVNRAHSLTITDAAAAAGTIELGVRNGENACIAAIDYLELNLDTSGPFSGFNCNPFPKKCTDGTPTHITTGTVDGWTATIEYPILDDSARLDPAAIGAGTQAVVAADGHPCERMSVSLVSEHDSFFARILGQSTQRTEVHSVALASVPVDGEIPLNLLLLERYDCDVLSAQGGGSSSGGILVEAVVDPDTGEVHPGYIAVDSDGTGSGCNSAGTIDVGGTGAEIRADGPSGCVGQIGEHTLPGGTKIGEGCGEIKTFAAGTPGCNWPACTNGGVLAPDPSQLNKRLTRARVDHRFNCKDSYTMPVGWEIEGCPYTTAPHIDNLVAAYGGTGTPPGFATFTSMGYNCNGSGNPAVIKISGNVHVDCNLLKVGDTIIFEGGDVVFDGSVDLSGSGVLAVNTDSSGPFPWGPSSDDAIAYFRGGTFSKSGSASVVMHNTMAYFAGGVKMNLAGGSGALIWIAPIDGSFEDLALWSESGTDHKFAGSAQLSLEGVFFVPWATVSYQGSGGQKSVEAQFIVRKLHVGGNGTLTVGPSFDRSIPIPNYAAQLIR